MTKREIREKQEKLWAKAWDDHDDAKITTKELRIVISKINWDAQYELRKIQIQELFSSPIRRKFGYRKSLLPRFEIPRSVRAV